MTPHHKATLTLILLLGGLLVLDGFYRVPWWLYLLPLFAFLLLAVIGSSRIDSGYHLPTLCHGSRDENRISLSFDDGPDPEVTPKVLDLLKEKGIRASFFVIGRKVQAHPELVERIHREGHFLGNHSWHHGFFFDLLPTRKLVEELDHTSRAIERITGSYPLAFRPPYGVTNPMLKRAVDRLGMLAVGWDVRSMDTTLSADRSAQRVMERLRPGSLLLFHDSDEKVVGILSQVLDRIAQKGYRWVSLEELLERDLRDDASLA